LKRVLVVDDHPIIAKACCVVLEPAGIGAVVAAHSAVSGYEAFFQHKPDVVVVDLSLHGDELAGLELIKRIRANDPNARILVFSMRADCSSFISAIEAGATGYLLKDASPEKLVDAVQKAGSGCRYIDPQFALKLAFPDTALSPSERRVLRLLLEDTPYAALSQLVVKRRLERH
jgi:DNA-binding NarL/FixJ family response regulator